MDATIEAFEAAIGLGRLHMVHLNDSRSELGSRADRHEHVGAGRIGGGASRRMATHPALDHVTYYLETPGMEEGYDAVNLDRVRDLVGRAPAGPAPGGRRVPHPQRQGAQRPRRGRRTGGRGMTDGATAGASARRGSDGARNPTPRSSCVLLAILALAALTRLPGLADRGRWDADQGHDMLELRAFVVDGTVPSLGPRTRSGPSTTAPSTTTCWPPRRRSRPPTRWW